MITLFPHQDLKFHEIRHHIDNGETDILFSSPMGSGKTRTLQYLIEDLKSSRMFNKYIIIVPFVSLKNSWLQLANLFSISNDAEFQYTAKPLSVADCKDRSFWEDYTDETFIVSRIAIGSKEVIDWLTNEKPNCSEIFILCDEGHHHADVNLAGKLCNILWKLGATIIRATGTPWHNLTELRNKNTKPVTLSFAEYARQLDSKTKKPFAPIIWESRKILVPFRTNDLSVAYEGSDLNKKINLPSEFKKSCIKSLIDQWVKDNCPKVIINIPRIEWTDDLIIAINSSDKIKRILNRDPRIGDFAGKASQRRKQQLNEILNSESKITDYNDSNIDVIISCNRMDEGVDWPLCSHVYNVRMPDSALRILQRWSRASRSKNRINNYPILWNNIQSITFFLPLLSENAKEVFWKEHKHTALIMACFMENHETAQKWCNTNAALDRFSEKLSKKSGKSGESGKSSKANKKSFKEIITQSIAETSNIETTQGSLLDQAEAFSELVQIINSQTDFSLRNISNLVKKKIGKGHKNYYNIISKLINLLKDQHPEILIKNVSPIKFSKNTILIKNELLALFENIVNEFENLEITIPDSLNIQICSFTAYDAETIQFKMKEHWDNLPIFSEELIRKEADNYKEQFGQYPTLLSGSWVGFGGMAWSGANLWLKEYSNKTLARFLGLRSTNTQQENVKILLDWKDKNNGRWPKNGREASEEEKSLYEKMYNLRIKNPELANEIGIPPRSTSSPEETICLIKEFYLSNNFYPTRSPTLPNNDRLLGKKLEHLRATKPELLIQHGIPLENNSVPPIILCELVREILINVIKFGNVYDKWRIRMSLGITWISINVYLSKSNSNPKHSRTLGFQPEICQITTLPKLISEIQNNCWKFKETSSDRYVYYSEIKRDDIEIDPIATAIRTHYLDWASSDSNIPDKKKFVLKPASN